MAARNADLPKDRAVQFRIGVNLGDVIVEGDDIFGDGVNVAARLEGIALPGSIAISGTDETTRNRLDITFEDLGERRLKNISQSVRVCLVRLGISEVQSQPVQVLPDKPSIAVLPFNNMSGDPEQEYFSDGISEDIITELSRYKSLFVVARNSSFVFRNRLVDVRAVGSTLGVLYVLEGSVRKAGNRIRVTAQLINATTGEHVWADRYDGDLVDVFVLQDEITRTIVSTIVGRLEDSQAERLGRRPMHDFNAYDEVLRGQKHLHQYTQRDYESGRECFQRAIEIDPKFAHAHAMLAIADVYCWFWDDTKARLGIATAMGERAFLLDPNESKCHLALGVAHLFGAAHDKAGYHLERASELNPNDDLTMVENGRYCMYVGQPDDGAALIRQAMRRNPYHPNWYWNILGRCFHSAGEFAKAIAVFERVASPPFWTHAYLTACHTAVGNVKQAAEHRDTTLALRPDFSVARFAQNFPYREQSDLARFLKTLSDAGLPP